MDDAISPGDETPDLYRMAWDLVNEMAREVLIPLKTATSDDLPGLRTAAALFDARIRFITKAMREGDRTHQS